MLLQVLSLSAVMVLVTVTVHFFGVTAILAVLRGRGMRLAPERHLSRQTVLILFSVLALIALHSVEIWAYAVVYIALGEFETLEAALYFSASTFSTVGYGDIVLDTHWRLMSAVESVNGFVLIGWSTAVLVSVIGRMRNVEDRWLSSRNQDA